MDSISNISELKNYVIFKKTGLPVLHSFLEELFCCDVNMEHQPIMEFGKYIGIDFLENIKRYAYVVDDDSVVLCVKIISEEKIIAMMPIYLIGKLIGKIRMSYLEEVGSAISIIFSECYRRNFRGGESLFGERLQDKVIASCFAKRTFNHDRISFLISFLKKLELLTFEGNNFTTGFILTRSMADYQGERKRNGYAIKVCESYNLIRNTKPDRRYWFLANGKDTFYLMNQNLCAEEMYIISKSEMDKGSFIDSYSLTKTLWGNDVAFRVINNNQISIINSEGIEFIGIENTWRFRDYNVLIYLLENEGKVTEEVAESIIFYIMYCSQNNISSIMWLPNTERKEILDEVLAKQNMSFQESICITNRNNENLIKRLLASDGVMVLNNSGFITMNGCVVNLNIIENKGLIGTGESATRILSKYGLAIKISQDGSIKIYYSEKQAPLIF